MVSITGNRRHPWPTSNEQAVAKAKSCQPGTTPILLKYKDQEIREPCKRGALTYISHKNKTKNVSVSPTRWNSFTTVQSYQLLWPNKGTKEILQLTEYVLRKNGMGPGR